MQAALDHKLAARHIRWLEVGAMVAAGTLAGFGLILWVAANWSDLGKVGRFGLVGTVIGIAAVSTATLPQLRTAASLVGVLAIGGLLALIGQTYQTGADPWQLFALWAALALPWVLAARHDAVWVVWVAIVFTALPLWAEAEGGARTWQSLAVVAPTWLLAAATSALLSPLTRLAPLTGPTPWAYRLAALLSLILVTSAASAALLTAPWGNAVAISGLALIAAAVAWLVWARPLDMALLAAATLALDTMLVLAIGRLVLEGNADTLGFLLVGLAAAGIVAGSAVLLLRVQARHQGAEAAAAPGRGIIEVSQPRTWPVAVLSGLGALLAAVPLLVAGAMLLGSLMRSGPGTYLLGGMVGACGLAVLRTARPFGFAQQLAFIAALTGLLLVGFGLGRDLPIWAACLGMAALTVASAAVVPAGWITALLGAATAALLVPPLADLLLGGAWRATGLAVLPWQLLTTAATAALAALPRWRGGGSTSSQAIAEPFASGWLAAALLGLMAAAGPTFLLSHGMGGGTTLGTAAEPATLLALTRLLSLATALVGVWLLLAAGDAVRRPVALALAAACLILTAVSPLLGPVVLALGVMLPAGRRTLAVLAAIAFVWIVGSFYYWLAWPLAHKGYLLMALGAGLGAVAAVAGETGRLPAAGGLRPGLSVAVAGLVAVSAGATATLAGLGIAAKERIIATGRIVYLPLAPVDPRSLIQGDYMALRFALPPRAGPGSQQGDQPGGARMYALARLDARNVGQVVSVGSSMAAAAGEVAIRLERRRGHWSLGPDAYYFKEGTGQRFEAARFGLLRVSDSGEAVLVGLATPDLNLIE